MKVYLDKDELIQITISVIAISFAFTMVFAGLGGLKQSPKEFFVFMLLSLVTVGSGFILHEMGHKLAAIYYGAQAKFRMWTSGLVFMLITSLWGVLLAAPGAVYIYASKITVKENGIISLAGPAVNLLLVGAFMVLAIATPIVFHLSFIPGPLNVWAFGAKINLILALFNLIPAFPLDGSKVLRWSKLIWIAVIAVFLGLGMVLIDPLIVFSWGVMMVIALIFSKLAFG